MIVKGYTDTDPISRTKDKYKDNLDLSAERARRAVAAGCVLTIDSDAHSTRELDFIRWGVTQARRAWVSSSNVVNTRSRADLLAWAAGKPDRIAG